MNDVRKTVFKLFALWQDDKYEQWLQKMSVQGWHLERVTAFPGVLFHFVKGEPKEYIYKLDYKPSRDKDIQEYKGMFKQAGWEYVTHDIVWKYFRKEVSLGGCDDIYTDSSSKIQMYKNIAKIMWVLLFAIAITLVNLSLIIINQEVYKKLDPLACYYLSLVIVIFLLMALTIYGILNIHKKIMGLDTHLQYVYKTRGSLGNNFMSKYVTAILYLEILLFLVTIFHAGTVCNIIPTYHPGWKQVAYVNFSDGDMKNKALYTFKTDKTRKVSFMVESKNFNVKKLIDLRVKGSNNTDILIVHGEQRWSNYNNLKLDFILEKGTYSVLINLQDAKGKLYLFVK